MFGAPAISTLYLALATSILATLGSASYVLKEDFLANPSNSFNGFNFYTGQDPTDGTVEYLSQSAAATSQLIGYNHEGIMLAVDSASRLDQSGNQGRKSVRLEGKNNYNHGLLIADVQHMPTGCGLWPAFWMLGAGNTWPSTGEIDIIEGVHKSDVNQMTLHTSAGCAVQNSTNDFSGTMVTSDCDVNDPKQDKNAGCGIQAPNNTASPATFGTKFNAQSGGVYATEWTSSGITIWFFPRNAIPADLASNTTAPNPQNWKQTPVAKFAGSGCSWDQHFKDMRPIINTDFCGAWAGDESVWESSGCKAQTQMDKCEDYVKMHPGNFTEAYWVFKGMRMYQQN
ncbi:MAG: hypothetical protein M1820_003973 [Bogoriella megaspora]|nr:MAG: hypothetical protein M1820_003973 [Bogoriella megaspora]